MNPHFSAFSFVGGIASVEPGVGIRGSYSVPAGVADFPASLVAEAVGQLAAWSAMSANGFARRPLAGIAGRIDLLSGVQPGQRLDLEAGIDSLDDDAVVYHGTASVNEIPVVRLAHCIGPMLATDEFDDPAALRERFDFLCGPTAAADGYRGLPLFSVPVRQHEHGKSLIADFRVPEQAPFFLDHFPRRPVFPGSLLMHLNMDLAESLAGDFPAPAPGERWLATRVEDVKLRTFIPPGQLLELEARLHEHAEDSLTVSVKTRQAGRVTGGALVRLSGSRR